MDFVNWSVTIDITFWTRLSKKKIEEYKLDDSPRPLISRYRLSNQPSKISSLKIDAYSFEMIQEDLSGPVEFKVHGKFKNTNTIEEFKAFKPTSIQEQLLQKQIQNFGKFVKGQSLSHFYQTYLLIFSDLKKHLFSYQFYSTATPVKNYTVINNQPLIEASSAQQLTNIDSLIRELSKEKIFPHFTILDESYKRSSISHFLKDNECKFYFLIADSSNLDKATGYHTSTVLAFFAWLRSQKIVSQSKLQQIKLILLKDYLIHNKPGQYVLKSSKLVTIDASAIEIAEFQARISHNKGVQQLDLKSFMDEQTLAKEAIDLNIKLMKWRLLPSLDIPKIQQTKCLLFGAGTLGCQLARNLIGWGIKNITFIDYSKVSYSNPVRQTLYEYEDTINGGKPKAETAAIKLKKIYPEINAEGYSIQIPMPGHFVLTQQQIEQTFKSLNIIQQLVKTHDVLFLLLDSREARWLPTVLANKYDKACITVGLGFDSFVIVRHGVPPQIHDQQKHGERLCCYFCNDIVTPQNTMKDRTLDQMCTVTKPGLSFVSSAYAAELYISLLHHPLGHHAPAHEQPEKLPTTDLGKLPHHLRGNMGDFETSIFYGKAFDQCVACSRFVLDEYLNDRDEFLMKVLNDPSFIHKVTKLQDELDMYASMEEGIIEIIDDDIDFITSDTFKNMEKGEKIQASQEKTL